MALLAATGARHNGLSGPAPVHLLRRDYTRTLYGEERQRGLSNLSVSHLYNLRGLAGRRARRGG